MKYAMETKVYVVMISERCGESWLCEEGSGEVYAEKARAEYYAKRYIENAKKICPDRTFRTRVVEKTLTVYGDEATVEEEV